MNEKLLAMINEHCEKGDFIGKVLKKDIAKAEETLQVNFPLEYKEFVEKFGSGGICGVDILGVEQADYASVVETTKNYRELGLPHNYLVVEDVDEFVHCLNTSKDYNVVRWDDISKEESIRYSTFFEYLTDSFKEAIDNCDE